MGIGECQWGAVVTQRGGQTVDIGGVICAGMYVCLCMYVNKRFHQTPLGELRSHSVSPMCCMHGSVIIIELDCPFIQAVSNGHCTFYMHCEVLSRSHTYQGPILEEPTCNAQMPNPLISWGG